MTVGLIVGKFLPPHRGHHFLIWSATSRVDHLEVWVADRRGDRIPAMQRAAWLAEVHPEITVRTVVDDIPDDQGDVTSEAWARRTVEVLGRAPDVVFTSEDYGDRWAHFLGCRHLLVDRERWHWPISATEVRADPAANWCYLEPSVRAALTRRICVVGAESTGTSTLAEALSRHYRTLCVPEYGREFAAARQAAADRREAEWEARRAERAAKRAAKQGTAISTKPRRPRPTPRPEAWRSEDFIHIALRQQYAEDRRARDAGLYLICDTDALATSIWHERYMRHGSTAVKWVAASRYYALYILTSDDIPFVQDGTRDGEDKRGWMTERFREELRKRPEPFVEVTGSPEQRLATAVAAIEALPRMEIS